MLNGVEVLDLALWRDVQLACRSADVQVLATSTTCSSRRLTIGQPTDELWDVMIQGERTLPWLTASVQADVVCLANWRGLQAFCFMFSDDPAVAGRVLAGPGEFGWVFNSGSHLMTLMDLEAARSLAQMTGRPSEGGYDLYVNATFDCVYAEGMALAQRATEEESEQLGITFGYLPNSAMVPLVTFDFALCLVVLNDAQEIVGAVVAGLLESGDAGVASLSKLFTALTGQTVEDW